MKIKGIVQILFVLTTLSLCERAFAKKSKSAVEAPKIINKMTETQCKAFAGRVEGDYPPSCKDNEIALGLVSMKCPCICCAPAREPRLKSADLPETVLNRIPPPKRKLFELMADSADWRNPLLIVRGNEVQILFRSTVKPGDLLKRLSTLPGDAWPYGKVVGVQQQPLGSKGDSEKIRNTLPEVLKLLKSAGILAVQWPSA